MTGVQTCALPIYGIRYVSGLFSEPDYIECVRTGTKIPTVSTGDVLFVQTSGFADDISPSEEFKDLISKIADGLESPLVDLSPYLKDSYSEPGEKNRKYAQQEVESNSSRNLSVIFDRTIGSYECDDEYW